jgi:hypothetical protein
MRRPAPRDGAPVKRNVAQQPKPATIDVPQHVAIEQRLEALEREVSELRRLLTEKKAKPAQSDKSRAEYYREYRKRKKA